MTPSRWRALILVMIILGGLIAGFFGLRTLRAFRGFREHRPPAPPSAVDAEQIETDVELIREWMTVPFIAKMYNVRPHVLFEALDIAERGNREKSLQQLNDEYYPESGGIVLEKVKAAVRLEQAQQIQENIEPPVVPVTPTGIP